MAKGQKTCPSCKSTTGPRAFKCPACNYEFQIKSKEVILAVDSKEKLKAAVESGLQDTPYILIYAPGKSHQQEEFCPFTPKSDAENDIVDWIERLKDYTFESCGSQCKYARTAIKYFAGYFWPMYITIKDDSELGKKVIDNPKYLKAVELINKNMQPYAREVLQGYN